MNAAEPLSLRCVAVDDEPLALSIISQHAAKIPFLHLSATFVSATEAVAYLHQTPTDVVFLDVEMPDVSGLELAAQLQQTIGVIFTTAHPQFAVRGFELAATDFLLKPIGFDRFLQACTRARHQLATREAVALPASLFVKDGYTLVRIDVASLQYLEGADNYLVFQEVARRTVVRLTLGEALARLPAGQFMRVHKSYVVALAHIEKIERHQVVVGGRSIPLSAAGWDMLIHSVKSK
jgi:two-component system LytT family response regulator